MLGLSSLAVALPKQCYQHAVLNFDPKPVLARVDGSSTFGQVFNPSWIEPSAATGQRSGLLIRSQNCSAAVGGTCVRCFGAGQKASVLTFSQLIGSDNAGAASPSFTNITSASITFAPHDDSDLQGTEDPRVAFDHRSQLYYMFYTCVPKAGPGSLCLATSPDPTSASGWTRHGPAFPGEHKSGALLIRDRPPHYLISGAGRIFISRSDSLLNWTLGDPFINQTLWGNPNVEAGPPPLKLADGNYVFFLNSWGGAGVPYPGYQPAWVVLDGSDPTAILAQASGPLWTPTDQPWMAGQTPYTCNVPQVAFLEAAHPIHGEVDAFRVYFGGADAVIGTAVVRIRRVEGVACEGTE